MTVAYEAMVIFLRGKFIPASRNWLLISLDEKNTVRYSYYVAFGKIMDKLCINSTK